MNELLVSHPEMAGFQDIWMKAKPLLANCRWWDLWHTEISIEHMFEILKSENREDLQEVLLPAIILHDIGWSTIGESKNVAWGEKDMRARHMDEGAKLSRTILEEIGYDEKLIERIVKLVATHDNVYLGIEQKTDEERLMRDADASFILSDLSFWKDYDVKGEGIAPQEFLEGQVKKHGERYSKTAQTIADKQIETRRIEIEDENITPQERIEGLRTIAENKNRMALQ